MKKRITACLVLLLLISLSFAQKKTFSKPNNQQKIQKHPYTHLLAEAKSANQAQIRKRRDPNYEKLLVILVDFQLEDSPNTTGNGKFLLEADPNWKTTIGSPPHDREYFEANMEALKYYYRAVSNESYNLQYDVFPKDKQAYTLSQTMSYYNPPSANSALFVQRMEEYFKEAFETADRDDPQIDFSQYAHFMIIHAGSDWQHDVAGDSPSDIPSFFIRVGSGKEAVVNGGAVTISTACNVPSMISQDFASFVDNDTEFHTGYGALNSVIAHEFGHSLGLVDLYNVLSFQPMVGAFDIMDSGGSGILIDQADDGSFVYVEGLLPGLPGAFSRELLFGDFFRNAGYMKDAEQVQLYKNFPLRASSARQNTSNPVVSLLRIPLNDTEYLLVENRSVDPDNDGGTALFGDLNGRVMLYPTAFADNNNNPTYEYDYLLPSFIAPNGASVGGGVLVWHIDEDIIYNQGTLGSDGNFYSNFYNNRVNTNYYKRGVKIIEADALPDIGYQYSYYWTGTPYEYFHKNKPVLNSSGEFVNWSQEIWKDHFTATSNPQLADNNGVPGMHRLFINANPAVQMSIRLESGFFDQYQQITTSDTETMIAPIISSSFSNMPELPLWTSETISLYTHNPQVGQEDWTNLTGTFDVNLVPTSFPVVKSNRNSNAFSELVYTNGNCIKFIEFANDELAVDNISFDTDVSATPLYHNGFLWVATETKLY
ncbi:MAG: hypothetical protein U1C33_08165, partial [Candidatus Cloacimonadaceae bacterium]|nr:hypothetical protein [Candidatus Cloacimonadaceae bacterium]